MAPRLSTVDLVVGILLVILGALALLGQFSLGPLLFVAAIAAIIVGILMLMGRIRGSQGLAIVLIVVGVLIVVPNYIGAVLGNVITIVVAVVLLVLGISKLMGKW